MFWLPHPDLKVLTPHPPQSIFKFQNLIWDGGERRPDGDPQDLKVLTPLTF